MALNILYNRVDLMLASNILYNCVDLIEYDKPSLVFFEPCSLLRPSLPFQRCVLAHLAQSLFNTLPVEELAGSTLVLGGDGRYFNKEASQVSAATTATLTHNLRNQCLPHQAVM